MESQRVEHKKTFGKEVIISLAAFANTDGGKVIVGVDDKGNACGVDVGPETLQRYQDEIKVATYPQLLPRMRIEEKDGKSLLVFFSAKKNKPMEAYLIVTYRCNAKCWAKQSSCRAVSPRGSRCFRTPFF